MPLEQGVVAPCQLPHGVSNRPALMLVRVEVARVIVIRLEEVERDAPVAVVLEPACPLAVPPQRHVGPPLVVGAVEVS
eukprot:scaffold29193_cov44-Phaeocystis_antarctica.AAC.1